MEIHGGDIYRNRVKLDFSVNTNPFGMPEGLPRVLTDAVMRSGQYPDIESAQLRSAIGNVFGLPEEMVLTGNGASEIFMGIMHALRPHKILLPVPSFYGYEYAARAAESEIIFYPLQEKQQFRMGEDILDALQEKISLLFLANPNNPTGQTINPSLLRKIIHICRQRKIWVVLDECFLPFCEGESSAAAFLMQYENLLLVRAFTKTYAIPGVRLGYLLCSNRELLAKIRGQLPEWNLSVAAQEAGVFCSSLTQYVKETRTYVGEERRFLTMRLQEMGIRVYDSSANFLLLNCQKPLYELLLERGILIRDCAGYRGLQKGFYRIAVKKREENRQLLKEIEEIMHEYGWNNRTSASGRN